MTPRRRIVVIGGGSCGCVVAERLTRDDDVDLILVEAGPAGAGDADLRLSSLPLGPSSTRVVHHSAAGGFDLPRGRGLGGSSAVNGGYFMRWHRDDFAGWDQRGWDVETIERRYDALDGGRSGGGTMSVRRFADVELDPCALAFEKHWVRAGYDVIGGPWTRVGVNRGRSNSSAGLRVPADRAYLHRSRGRPGLAVQTETVAHRLVLEGPRVRAVEVVGRGGRTTVLPADEVILCAGTLASAAILARSTGVGSVHPLGEHRELLVRFRTGAQSSTTPQASSLPLLPTVLHTEDGMEIRCYNGDFADHIDGVPATGAAIGVALMTPRGTGSLSTDSRGDQRVDLGDVDADDLRTMRMWAGRVVEMLDGAAYSGLVEPGSAAVDSSVQTSQHAWGSLPMGAATDWTGALVGVEGVRVVDGSILPTSGSSGPHETIMMVATGIAELMATGN